MLRRTALNYVALTMVDLSALSLILVIGLAICLLAAGAPSSVAILCLALAGGPIVSILARKEDWI